MPDRQDYPAGQTESRERWVAPRRETPLSGILNIDKPAGLTSHDVVNVVRRLTGQRKVGHTGALDPMATGVLVVCLGQATRLAEYLMAGRKRYRAVIVLGTSTDTYDAEGQVVSSAGRTDFSRAEIEAALSGFSGRIEQVPPMYSALKRDGQPLYKLARQGKTVERPPRPVDIYDLRLLDWTPPALTIEVTCSPGTYIRSLAHDLGQRLGSAAYLAGLVRLSSGQFTLEEAVSLDRLEEAFRHGEGVNYLLPLDAGLLDWPALVVGAEEAQRIAQGRSVEGPPLPAGDDKAPLCRAYSLAGDFLAVMVYDMDARRWRPKKVFAPAQI